jgi:hypothetical protein
VSDPVTTASLAANAATALALLARGVAAARAKHAAATATVARAEVGMVPELLARIERLEGKLDAADRECEAKLEALRAQVTDAQTQRAARALADADDLARLHRVIASQDAALMEQGRRLAELERALRALAPTPPASNR